VRAQRRGVQPDVVVAHSGWGAGTYAKAVWPDARFVPYLEWWYRWPRVDVLPGDRATGDPVAMRANAAARNTPMLLDLAQADAVLCPTQFQADQLPSWLHPRLTVQHDGIDCAAIAPDPDARARLARYGVPDGVPVVTYATRGMEPYRGFPTFMRALARLQAIRTDVFAIIGGEDRVAYGEPLPAGESWKRRMLAELDLDLARVRFTGLLPRNEYRTLLQASDLHVYLTIPFVLSWSFIEAMSAAAPLVASDVEPVREALGGGGGALLVDNDDPEALAMAMARTLDYPDMARRRGHAARARALQAYDQALLWPARAELLRRLASDEGRQASL
jgi:glycosyltransferase involved in cell wall biosynthesis